MTAAATKPLHEPEERDDPRNALLDAAEELIRSCVAHGLGPQIEARLAKLFPKPAAPPSAAATADTMRDAIILAALREGRARCKAPSSAALFETAIAAVTGDEATLAAHFADPAAALAKHRKSKDEVRA
ncbi:MAG: hypothetical protein CTY28_14480 [Hyphomicrobium sp.]|nr:MAG: hypothetical protein CTY28_14480 [Hyphomicrobium sp.]